MPEYQFANNNGDIVKENYDRTSYLSTDQVLLSIKRAFALFPYETEIIQVEGYDDVYKVTYPNEEDMREIFICGKGTTPGGRKGLQDEQRIQPKAKYLNYVYNQQTNGKNGVFLGVYSKDSIEVFCTWKVTISNATSPETPISKQIKINSIAKAIKEGFVQQDKGKGEYACAFRPEFLYFYLRNSDWLHCGVVSELSEHTLPESNELEVDTMNDEKPYEPVNYDTGLKTDFPLNRIVFGAPGTGKSFELEVDRKKLLNDGTVGDYERVTFHPDYTYAQFVGTYKPVMYEADKIGYDFVPGPFMRIYVEALKNSREDNPQPYILLIEEINRAKVAAVFGDIFQLLDRTDNGISMYEIQASEDIRKFLAKELGGHPDNYKKIMLPNNMFIWATMNSADQGVFPMDTAFKRRWDFEYLGIDANDEKVVGTVDLIEGNSDSNISWNRFRKAINEKLANEYKVNEDKLLGPYFLSNSVIATNSETDNAIKDPEKFRNVFKSKVLMYLYEDAGKQHKHKLFAGCDSTKYSAVCDAFDEIGMNIFGESFKEDYYDHQEG